MPFRRASYCASVLAFTILLLGGITHLIVHRLLDLAVITPLHFARTGRHVVGSLESDYHERLYVLCHRRSQLPFLAVCP